MGCRHHRAAPGRVDGCAGVRLVPGVPRGAPDQGVRPGPGRAVGRRQRRRGRCRPGSPVGVRLGSVHAPPDGTDRPALPPGPSGPGRSPKANPTRGRQVRPTRGRIMSLTIGVDVGGTKVAAGVVDEQGRIVEKLKRATPSASPPQTAETIAGAVTELLGRHEVAAVGIGAAGFVDEVRSSVLFAPNLAWRDEPLQKEVEARIGVPVIVENDANAAVWAETMLGAARGQEHVMLVAVGTGIGAGIVINGELYRGRWGIAGEPGHYRVVPERPAVRVRQPRLLGAVRKRQRPGRRGTRVRQARAERRGGAAEARRGQRGRHQRPPDHRGRARGRRGRAALFRDRGRLARSGPGRAGRHPRSWLLRDRRRRIGRG